MKRFCTVKQQFLITKTNVVCLLDLEKLCKFEVWLLKSVSSTPGTSLNPKVNLAFVLYFIDTLRQFFEYDLELCNRFGSLTAANNLLVLSGSSTPEIFRIFT